MRLIAVAIITAALCICSAIADAAPSDSITGTAEQFFWSGFAGAALVFFVIVLIVDWGKD